MELRVDHASNVAALWFTTLSEYQIFLLRDSFFRVESVFFSGTMGVARIGAAATAGSGYASGLASLDASKTFEVRVALLLEKSTIVWSFATVGSLELTSSCPNTAEPANSTTIMKKTNPRFARIRISPPTQLR